MFSSRGKLFVNLALKKPNKGFLEYKQTEYLTPSPVVQKKTVRQPKRYIFEESDDDCEEDNLYACHSDTEINAITESQTLQKVYDILTPPKSMKLSKEVMTTGNVTERNIMFLYNMILYGHFTKTSLRY